MSKMKWSDPDFLLCRARYALLKSKGFTMEQATLAMGLDNENARMFDNIDYDVGIATEKQMQYFKDILADRSGNTRVGKVNLNSKYVLSLGFPLGTSIKHYQDAIEAAIAGSPEIFNQDLQVAEWIKMKGIAGRELTVRDYDAFTESMMLSPLEAMRAAVTGHDSGNIMQMLFGESMRDAYQRLSGHQDAYEKEKKIALERERERELERKKQAEWGRLRDLEKMDKATDIANSNKNQNSKPERRILMWGGIAV